MIVKQMEKIEKNRESKEELKKREREKWRQIESEKDRVKGKEKATEGKNTFLPNL